MFAQKRNIYLCQKDNDKLKKNNGKFKIDYSKIKSLKIYPNSQKKLLQINLQKMIKKT